MDCIICVLYACVSIILFNSFSNVYGFASYGPIWTSAAAYYNITPENV